MMLSAAAQPGGERPQMPERPQMKERSTVEQEAQMKTDRMPAELQATAEANTSWTDFQNFSF